MAGWLAWTKCQELDVIIGDSRRTFSSMDLEERRQKHLVACLGENRFNLVRCRRSQGRYAPHADMATIGMYTCVRGREGRISA